MQQHILFCYQPNPREDITPMKRRNITQDTSFSIWMVWMEPETSLIALSQDSDYIRSFESFTKK